MLDSLQDYADQALSHYKIPAVSLALWQDGHLATAASGVLNLNTGVSATPDALFQIGSITKVLTTSLVMQLVDEGRVELDRPIRHYMPDFLVADEAASAEITVAQLLNHTNGIDGDFFPRTDTGDKAIEELLGMSGSLPFLFDPGTNYSYNNIGFSALGRVIEVIDQRSFDVSLRKRIFAPLDMDHALSRPEDNLRFRAAVGHLPDPKHPDQLIVPKVVYLTIGHKAAGSTPAMTASDLLNYAAVHKNKGVGLNGNRILSARSVREMQKPQVTCKDRDWPWQVGQPWRLAKWGAVKIYGHPGGTVGQGSDLTICNEKDIAVVCLTNGGNAAEFSRTVVSHVFKSVKVNMFKPPMPAKKISAKPEVLVGRFRNVAVTVDITDENGTLMMAATPSGFAGIKAGSEIGFVNPRLAIANKMAIEMGGKPGQPCDWIRIGGRMLLRV